MWIVRQSVTIGRCVHAHARTIATTVQRDAAYDVANRPCALQDALKYAESTLSTRCPTGAVCNGALKSAGSRTGCRGEVRVEKKARKKRAWIKKTVKK